MYCAPGTVSVSTIIVNILLPSCHLPLKVPELAVVVIVRSIGPLGALAPSSPDIEILDAGSDAVSGRFSASVKVMVFASPGLAFD